MATLNVRYKSKTNVSNRIRSDVSIENEEVYDSLQPNKFASIICLYLFENLPAMHDLHTKTSN